MFQQLRRGLTYSNVTATMALVVAMGGGAYALTKGEVRSDHIANNAVKSRHIAKNAAKGADVKEASLKGIGLGLGGGEWELPAGQNGGRSLAPIGRGTGIDSFFIAAPRNLKVSEFTVLLTTPQTQGTREFFLQEFHNGVLTQTSLCTISANENSCSASASVKIEKGHVFRFWLSFSDSPPATSASYGWRALTR